jgi:hypothetical protein
MYPMATKAKSSAAIANLTAEVTVALADPKTVLARLALYESAEKKDRHTAAGVSILRYALEGYVSSAFEVPDRYNAWVEATDESVIISGEHKNTKRAATDNFSQEIAYPLWLAEFFRDENNFKLLLEGDETPLEEVIATMTAHVESLDAESDDDPDEDDDDEIEAGEEDEDPEDDEDHDIVDEDDAGDDDVVDDGDDEGDEDLDDGDVEDDEELDDEEEDDPDEEGDDGSDEDDEDEDDEDPDEEEDEEASDETEGRADDEDADVSTACQPDSEGRCTNPSH